MSKIKEEILLQIARNIFKLKKIKINFGPEQIHSWDSIGHVKFILEIEKKFKKKISFQKSLKISKIKDILKLI